MDLVREQVPGRGLSRIITRARHSDIGTVYIKSGDSNDTWSQFNRPLIQRLHRGGLDVCAWQFVYGSHPVGEAKVGAASVRRGADCLVIDAEGQYEGKYAAADRYIRALRRRIGGSFPLSLAGFPYVDYHPAFPYSVFLGPGGAHFSQPQPETLNGFIEAEIEELRDFLQKIKADRDVDRRAKKEIEKAIKRFEAKLVIKSDMNKDSAQTITWDQMGIDMMVVDEFHCLPYESRVVTDRGLLPIGEIVEKRLPVLVKSVDLSTDEVKWMPVTGWFNNPQSAPMVRIVHEKGVFECTANHKVWTYEEGYIEAGKLTQKHTLKNLSNLQKGIRLQPARQGGTEASALFSSMPKEWSSQNRNKALRTMWKGIHFQINRQKKQRQEKILWKFLCSKMENDLAGTQGIGEGISATRMGGISGSNKGQTQPGSICSHEGQQSDGEPRVEKENVEADVWPNLFGQRRQWNSDLAAASCCVSPRSAYGISNTYAASEGSLQISAPLLQSGCGRSIEEVSNRNRWRTHNTQKWKFLDKRKTAVLKALGWSVLRFSN